MESINGSDRNGTLTSSTGLTLIGNWYLPRVDKVDPMQNLATGMWLTVRDSNAEVGTEIGQEPLWVNVTDGPNNQAHAQKWRRSATDENGYFTLKNTNCKKFLMASRGIYPDKIVVERMNHEGQ